MDPLLEAALDTSCLTVVQHAQAQMLDILKVTEVRARRKKRVKKRLGVAHLLPLVSGQPHHQEAVMGIHRKMAMMTKRTRTTPLTLRWRRLMQISQRIQRMRGPASFISCRPPMGRPWQRCSATSVLPDL